MAEQAKHELNHFGAAFIACLPFAILQILFLSDTAGFEYILFGYGVIEPVSCMVAFLWLIYLIAEIVWRNKGTVGNRVPYFSVAGAILLAGFFLPGLLIRPVLETLPSFCRATQVTRWSTSGGDFILVAIGTGTVNKYRFDHGYMNWTGDGPAGFSSLHVQPIEFQYNYFEPHLRGSIELLRNRMANSGLEDAELDSVSSDIWSVLQQASEGTEVKTALGIMDNVESGVADGWDAKIGGMTWLIVLFAAFLIVSRFTIYPAQLIMRSA